MQPTAGLKLHPGRTQVLCGVGAGVHRVVADGRGVALLPQLSPAAHDHVLEPRAELVGRQEVEVEVCLLYTSPSPRDVHKSRMPSSA